MSEKTITLAPPLQSLRDRAGMQPSQNPANPLFGLQRSVGNQAILRLLSTDPIQPNLRVSPPDDVNEMDADRVADHVMKMPPLARSATSSNRSELRRKHQECSEDHGVLESLARKKSAGAPNGQGTPAPPIVHEVLRSPGRPLDHAARSFFEPLFERDFGQVRIHTDNHAAKSAAAVNALAYTVGNNLVFGTGRYAPDSAQGQRLLAHELTHVAQQSQNGHLRLQRTVSGNVLSVHVTAEIANAMTDPELTQQMNILRSHLRAHPHDLGAQENLSVLESVAYQRQGTARESHAPAAVPAPGAKQAAPATEVASMSPIDKLIEAYHRSRVFPALGKKIESLITPKALVIAIISFAVTFLASQLTPVGWAADIAIALTAAFIATGLFAAIKHMVNFAEARNATTSEELDIAGDEFADGVAEVGVDAILLLVTHGIGGKGGGPPVEGPPPAMVRLGVTPQGFAVAVAADTVPATVSVTTAVGLGVKSSVIAGPLLSVGAGGGRGSSNDSGGGSEPPTKDGPYKDIKDNTTIERGRDFTPTQKRKIIQANRDRNSGVIRSDDPDDPFQVLGDPEKSVSAGMGGSPQNPAMAAVDHIASKFAGGSNDYGNARVISQQYNNFLRSKAAKAAPK